MITEEYGQSRCLTKKFGFQMLCYTTRKCKYAVLLSWPIFFIVVKLCRFQERFYCSLLAKNKSFSPRTWSCLFTSVLSVFYMVKPIEELNVSNYWLYMSVKFSCSFLPIFSSIICIFQVYINVYIYIYTLLCFLHILCLQFLR